MSGRDIDIIVVGGGPAGLMAAGEAARHGAGVLLLEKMRTCGRKLSITGKGRCNLTNTAELTNFIEHFGRHGRFLHQAFARFFSPELMSFFESLGIALTTERGGRIFPSTHRAPDLTAALCQWVADSGVRICTGRAVRKLQIKDGRVVGVKTDAGSCSAGAVILATGGASYPGTGSTGDGYRLAEAVGHHIHEVRPALVPLETAGADAARLEGLGLRNAGVRLFVDGKKRREAFGELEFEEYGINGPTVLTLSGEAVDALRRKQQVEMVIDLKPALDEQKLDARLLRDLAARGKEPVRSILRGLLPRQMVGVSLDATELPAELPGSRLTAEQRRRLLHWLKAYPLTITGHRPFSEAIVTAGGVDLREVDPRTMQSRRIAGLFIAGELLDLHGDTGGYNLQAAFSTGWLAGRAAAQAITRRTACRSE